MIHINDNISPNDYLTSVLILLAKSTKYRFKHKVRRATLRVITWKTNDNHGAGRHNIRLIYFFLFLFCFHSSMASCVCGAFFRCTTSGLASWDSVGTQIDIEAELRNIAAQCPNGEEVRNGTYVSHNYHNPMPAVLTMCRLRKHQWNHFILF